jgi:nucleotide-binding universal stress UspA family protein
VVVAVDGSDASVRALVWAMQLAVERGLRVEALTAWPLHGSVFVREVAGHFCEPRWRAREVQAESVARALAVVPKAPAYDQRVVNATLVDALSRARKRAAMVVMGSDGAQTSGKGPRLSEQVRRTVPGPVVVVGPEGPLDDDDVEALAADLHPLR